MKNTRILQIAVKTFLCCSFIFSQVPHVMACEDKLCDGSCEAGPGPAKVQRTIAVDTKPTSGQIQAAKKIAMDALFKDPTYIPMSKDLLEALWDEAPSHAHLPSDVSCRDSESALDPDDSTMLLKLANNYSNGDSKDHLMKCAILLLHRANCLISEERKLMGRNEVEVGRNEVEVVYAYQSSRLEKATQMAARACYEVALRAMKEKANNIQVAWLEVAAIVLRLPIFRHVDDCDHPSPEAVGQWMQYSPHCVQARNGRVQLIFQSTGELAREILETLSNQYKMKYPNQSSKQSKLSFRTKPYFDLSTGQGSIADRVNYLAIQAAGWAENARNRDVIRWHPDDHNRFPARFRAGLRTMLVLARARN